MSIGHVDKIDELILIVPDVEVEEFDQEGVNRQDACVYSYFSVESVYRLYYSFLDAYPELDFLFYFSCLLEFYIIHNLPLSSSVRGLLTLFGLTYYEIF